mgnify:CR=1 FL=1
MGAATYHASHWSLWRYLLRSLRCSTSNFPVNDEHTDKGKQEGFFSNQCNFFVRLLTPKCLDIHFEPFSSADSIQGQIFSAGYRRLSVCHPVLTHRMVEVHDLVSRWQAQGGNRGDPQRHFSDRGLSEFLAERNWPCRNCSFPSVALHPPFCFALKQQSHTSRQTSRYGRSLLHWFRWIRADYDVMNKCNNFRMLI